jgi:hypothetical protein
MSAEVINLAIALATCIAAWAACVAAIAAKRQGGAAWEQVKLLRPRPVLVVEGSWSLETDADRTSVFVIRNVGSSPAFDIDISEIEGPLVPSVGYSERLITERIFVIGEGSAVHTVQHRCAPGNQFDRDAAFDFLKVAGQSFAPTDEAGSPLRHMLKFALTYLTLEGTRFTTLCTIRFHLGLGAFAKIDPEASWLGANSSDEIRR